MPKEVIYGRHHGTFDEPSPVAEIGWSREAAHVELQVAPQRDRADNIRTIPEIAIDELKALDPKWGGDSNYADVLNLMALVYDKGWVVQLDREGINRMIRALRKARDAAYGADA